MYEMFQMTKDVVTTLSSKDNLWRFQITGYILSQIL